MAELFDPTMVDFSTQTATADRQRKLADFLRQQFVQSQSQQPTQGTMVGRQWIAPSAAPGVMNAFQGYEAMQADKTAQAGEQALSTAQQAAAQRWRASLPQSTPAQPGTPDQAATPFGSRDMPQQDALPGSPAVPFKPVSAGDRLKAAMAGMANPLTAKEAVLWNAGMAEETKREDDQAARIENLRLTQQAQREQQALRLEQQALEAQRRSEDTRLAIVQRKEAAEQAATLRVELAKLAVAARQGAGSGIAAERQLRREERNADKIDRQVEHIGTKMKDVAPLLVSGQAVQDMFDRTPGKVPAGLGFVGRATPTGMMPAEWTKNSQAVQALVNSLVRNQAGLSQTLSETQNAKLELIVNGTATGQQFMDAWEAIRDKVNAYPQTIGASYAPEAIQIYNSRGGNLKPIVSKHARSVSGPAAPVPAATGWKVEEVK